MKLFLEWHWLLEELNNTHKEKYYLPLLEWATFTQTQKLANTLRWEEKDVNIGLSVKKLPKAIKYADKNNYSHIVILWEQELEIWKYTVKNLKTGEEERVSL